MIRFPSALNAETFLGNYWQKQPLYMPGAAGAPKPSITRNELGWLATLDDVESRIVFTDRRGPATRYRAETGPFDIEFLRQLPKRDWTLLVHDVEKHLPELRALFDYVPFIPDWRIDDLMVSFAAPGGGVGPHRDNYDVFLVQGTGTRRWQVSQQDVARDSGASDDLALLREFDGDQHDCVKGDILYLPPGVPHWGTAERACVTYSIGMRAPQVSDLVDELPDDEAMNPFYQDPDLSLVEVAPGYISQSAMQRAERLVGRVLPATALGRSITLGKDWLCAEKATPADCELVIDYLNDGGTMEVHGMSRIAWDDGHVYVNGEHLELAPDACDLIKPICSNRAVSGPFENPQIAAPVMRWLLQQGTFDLTAIS